MSDTNVVILKGRLIKSAELKYTKDQKPFVNFSLAVNDSIKNQTTGEWENRPNFFDATSWGKYAESVAKYMTKGREILITGRLKQGRWNNAEGKPQSRISIFCENFELLREPKGNTGNAGSAPQAYPPEPQDAPNFDGLPPSDVNGYTETPNF